MKPYYSRDGITLYHADCRELLATMPAGSVDAVVTDPPYGVSHVSNRAKAMRDEPIYGDSDTASRDEVLAVLHTVPQIVFGTWRRKRPESVRGVLIWDKGGAVGMGDLSFPWKPSFEEIYVIGQGFSGTRGGAVLRHVVNAQAAHGVNGDGWLHPHEKPIPLLEDLIDKCPGTSILDPFAGSCTTGVAAWNLGRKAMLCEISEEYCELGAKRLDRVISQGRLFKPEPVRETQTTLFEEQE